MSSGEVHRPGIFKQRNKSHKTGRHRSKGIIAKEIKGMFWSPKARDYFVA